MFAVFLGFILGFIHYFSENLADAYKKYKGEIVSFGSAIFITYLFLELLPYLYNNTESYRNILFVFILVGFVSVHVVEKYLYRYTSKHKLRKELKELHSILFFVYHFIIGIVLVVLLDISFSKGVLFFIPIFVYTAISGISLSELHMLVRGNLFFKILLSASTLIGVLIAELIFIPSIVYFILLSFVSGGMFHIAVREAVPHGREGRPLYFLLGTVVYIILIIILWNIIGVI